MGKPSKYNTHVKPYLDQISRWIQNGASLDEVADKLHISKSTLSLYLKKGREGDARYSDFSDCYARACVEPDDEVEAALFKLACGYTVDLQKTFKLKRSVFDPETGRKVEEYEELVTGIDQAHVAANVEAQKFWLANRRRDKWKYKPEPERSDDDFCGVIQLPPVMDPEGKK